MKIIGLIFLILFYLFEKCGFCVLHTFVCSDNFDIFVICIIIKCVTQKLNLMQYYKY